MEISDVHFDLSSRMEMFGDNLEVVPVHESVCAVGVEFKVQVELEVEIGLVLHVLGLLNVRKCQPREGLGFLVLLPHNAVQVA